MAKFTHALIRSTALAALVAAASAPAAATEYLGFGVDTNGTIVRNSYGECWKTGSFNPDAPLPPECGGGPVDSDGDGVYDDKDQCPDTPKGMKVDSVGCEIVSFVLDGVLFDFDKATLTHEGMMAIDSHMAKIKRNLPRIDMIDVIGHTDSVGSDAYNQKLSEARAKTVGDYLVQQGVPAGKVMTKGMGESQPVADNSTKAGRAANRRVVVEVK